LRYRYGRCETLVLSLCKTGEKRCDLADHVVT
jgi:hypothetical protein